MQDFALLFPYKFFLADLRSAHVKIAALLVLGASHPVNQGNLWVVVVKHEPLRGAATLRVYLIFAVGWSQILSRKLLKNLTCDSIF